MEALMICLAVLAVFVVPLFLTLALTKAVGLPGWLITAVPAGALSAYWMYMADAAPGWEGLGYAFLLVFGAAPAVVGIVLGGVIGKYKRATA